MLNNKHLALFVQSSVLMELRMQSMVLTLLDPTNVNQLSGLVTEYKLIVDP